MDNSPTFRPSFTLEECISGVSAMGCGLFDSKIVLAGGFSGAGENTVYNRSLVTYDPVNKKVSWEDFPDMRGRKIRPLVFEVYGRLYVLDTSNSVHKRTWELYYPTKKIWAKVSDPFCSIYNALTGIKSISGRHPYSWFVCGNTVSISSPAEGLTYFHHTRQATKLFSTDASEPLPFHGMATTFFNPGFCNVVVISFSKGLVGGQGRVEGHRLRYCPFKFLKSELIFYTDPYEKPDGEVSCYFAECGKGKFCLTTFDNFNIHVYVFKILRHEAADGSSSLVLIDLDKHKYNFTDFSDEGFTSISLSGCFVLPRDDGPKRSEESKLYHNYFLCYESEEKDDDIPPLIATDKGLMIDPAYDSGGGDSDFEVY
ncbi:hypothetical protein ACET3Z_012214 [Daucus carota]